ncbi:MULTISPECIES: helix-turn-helix domain-containing protein [unclassified Burkholderia]|uniref:helix-turn-helix domain-containing protein n=1 Tax=unclassified Burkholderia TaxID=2613784 RepID=UPI00119A5C7F|nr:MULTISPECIES: helix-turn-helix domain-containing protein [unclassified Burkholderia]TWC59661.1 AraC-like DNA-binding protein [Burkholderia sp. SJZ089]TWC94638.1 AraC-like DNA-binding protein [Burkholderia sp. SJZ115]TWC96550.1 AraC-like DNA-binding protein [Burkholderia sp. SJZ091]
MDNIETFSFSTRKFMAQEPLDASPNRSAMAYLRLCRAGIGASADLDGVFRGTQVGDLMLGTLRYTTKIVDDPITYDAVRTPQRIKFDGFDHYFFRSSHHHTWQSKSEAGVVPVGARQLFFADLAQPLCIDIQSGDVVILMVQRDLIPIDLSSRHGNVFSGLTALLASQYILGLAEHIDTISKAESKAIGEVTLNMLLAAAAPTRDHIEPVRSSLEKELIKKVKAHINAQLESPKLCVETICHDIGLSRAALYRLFSTEKHGVAEYIKLLRLRKIHYILRHSTESRIRISELANRYGFCYNSSFAKLFKRYFDCAPSDVRRHAAVDARPATAGAVGASARETRAGVDAWHHFPTQVF